MRHHLLINFPLGPYARVVVDRIMVMFTLIILDNHEAGLTGISFRFQKRAFLRMNRNGGRKHLEYTEMN